MSVFHLPIVCIDCFFFFFFNDTATTEIYTLSLHDALPISRSGRQIALWVGLGTLQSHCGSHLDRKSTRLNSSHQIISYAVFCLKKKKRINAARISCGTPPSPLVWTSCRLAVPPPVVLAVDS